MKAKKQCITTYDLLGLSVMDVQYLMRLLQNDLSGGETPEEKRRREGLWQELHTAMFPADEPTN